MKHNTFINIAIWNANGLAQRILELKYFLIEKDIDVMLISETHFTQKNYIKIPNYTVYNTNHPDQKAHGGTAIIIKTKIKHYELNKISEVYLQATNITIEDTSGSFTLSAIYCPPKFQIKKEIFINLFNQLGNRFIAGGDYNAKHPWWGSRSSTPNPKGRQLYAALQSLNCFPISTGEPTYWPSDTKKLPDLIDFAVVKGINANHLTIKSCFDLSSDHSPVLITLNSQIIIKQTTPSLYNKKTNWNKYQEYLENNLNCNIPLKTPKDLEDAVESINILIHKAVNYATTTSEKNVIKKINYYIPKHILEKIQEKRKLRKNWQVSKCPMLKTKLNQTIKNLKKLLNEEKNRGIENYLNNLTTTEDTNYSLWKATKKLKQPIRFTPPIKRSDGKWARTDQDKTETFAMHLNEVFKPLNQQITQLEEDILLRNEETQNQEDDIPFLKTTTNEIYKIIKNLNNKKSSGYDKIDGKLIKNLPNKMIRFIAILINAVFRLNHFPAQWKVAQIIMILKPGKPPDSVTSYRPISLLPVMSKICEKTILSRLYPTILEKKIIPNHQFGFRNKHSTIEQVNRLTTEIKKIFEAKSYGTAVFLDVAQAFDKVWHNGLLYKLKKYFSPKLYKLLESYLTARTFQVKINEQESKLYTINAGVPQGSVLGPILYLIYTADIPLANDIMIATYADDTAILSSNINPSIASKQLQDYLTTLEAWFKKWRIKINENKSTHITFTLCKHTCPAVEINGMFIPQNNQAKYLGMYLDRRLTWQKHIWTKRKQLQLKLKNMYWLLGNKSTLSLKNKILLYKAILKPIWTYGIQLWGASSISNINIFERFQSKTLRNIVNAPWFVSNEIIRKDLNIPTVMEEISNYHLRYTERLLNHPNQLATDILLSRNITSRLRRFKNN